MNDLIESVATQLGMIRAQRGNEREPCIVIGGKVGYRKSNWLNLDFVILLSAYAKAEMAKRGWLIEYQYPGLDYHNLYLRLMAYGKCAKPFKYDPTDPISEAKAVLRCIAEVLQSNPAQSRAPKVSRELTGWAVTTNRKENKMSNPGIADLEGDGEQMEDMIITIAESNPEIRIRAGDCAEAIESVRSKHNVTGRLYERMHGKYDRLTVFLRYLKERSANRQRMRVYCDEGELQSLIEMALNDQPCTHADRKDCH